MALQAIYTQARSHPEMCHWADHFKAALLQLLECMQGVEEAPVRTLALRILREMLKTEHNRLAEYTEITTLRVLAQFTDTDATVSCSVYCMLCGGLASQTFRLPQQIWSPTNWFPPDHFSLKTSPPKVQASARGGPRPLNWVHLLPILA